jgi:hypothetical protein
MLTNHIHYLLKIKHNITHNITHNTTLTRVSHRLSDVSCRWQDANLA